MITKLWGALMLKLSRLIVKIENARKEHRKTRIIKLGGVPKERYDSVINNWVDSLATAKRVIELNDKILQSKDELISFCDEVSDSLTVVETTIDINPNLGYTEDNVIEQSRQQVYYQLGKEVYPYARHFVGDNGKYKCSVTVQENMSETDI